MDKHIEMDPLAEQLLNSVGAWSWEEKKQFLKCFLNTLDRREPNSARNIAKRSVRSGKNKTFAPVEDLPLKKIPAESPLEQPSAESPLEQPPAESPLGETPVEQPQGAASKEQPRKATSKEQPQEGNLREHSSAGAGRLRVGRDYAVEGWWSTWFEDQVVAMDCEMVSVPIQGKKNKNGRQAHQQVLGIVSFVDFYGNPVNYEKVLIKRGTFLATGKEKNGINETDLENGKPMKEVMQNVKKILHDKLVVGHAIENDFRCMNLESGEYEHFDLQWNWWRSGTEIGSPRLNFKLRSLVFHYFGDDEFQIGDHNAQEDAIATMAIFRDFYIDEKINTNININQLMERGNLEPSDFIVSLA